MATVVTASSPDSNLHDVVYSHSLKDLPRVTQERINGTSESEQSNSNPSDGEPNSERTKSMANRESFDNFLKTTQKSDKPSINSLADMHEGEVPNATGRIIEQVRQYQQELYERALVENIIAVLDTGSGKTLIACLLVRNTLLKETHQRAQGQAPKVIFFLANSVHLVQQQARVLTNNLTKKPVIFVGHEKANVWKQPSVWSKIVEDGTPIVCTPAVLKQCLDTALVRMDQISLLVFDEAHHTKKNHPYSMIIRSHYLKCDLDMRPRVFGMTASPVDSKGSIESNITNLEELLHCKVVTARDPSMLSFTPKPKDLIWRYHKHRLPFDTDFSRLMKTKLGVLDDAEKAFLLARHATSTLGSWCADRIWHHIIGSSDHKAAELIKRFEQSPANSTIESLAEKSRIIGNLKEATMLVRKQDNNIPVADTVHMSDKVLLLYKELLQIYATQPKTRAIVFVDQRLTAHVLHDCFVRLGVPNLRTGLLLGTAQDATSLKKQEKFMDQFRQGLVNLIFATSVADEGIDIPQCNLCIRFDLYKSPIQYIQSRGRARTANSVYVHMIEEDNARHEIELDYAISSDRYIREYCERLDPDRLLGRGTRLEEMILRDSNSRSFKTRAGAICDFDNSLLVLSRFANSLRHVGSADQESYECEIDEINKQFRYVVKLPANEIVKITGARGEWKPNKQLAKRSAAWNCCFLLRQNGLLSETLTSPYHKVKPQNLNARLAISDKKCIYQMLAKPSVWQIGLGHIPEKLYLSILHLKPQQPVQKRYSPVACLTRIPMPSFPNFTVYLENFVKTDVEIETSDFGFEVSIEEVDALTNFTLNGVFLDIFNKAYESDNTRVSYWLAPLSQIDHQRSSRLCDILDMEALNLIKQGRIQWSPGCPVDNVWTDKFVVDPRNGKFHYFTKGIAPGVSAFDPVPSSIPAISQKSAKNIIDFSDSSWKASKTKFIESAYDPSQPVLSAELITTHRNYLEPTSGEHRSHIECLIAPQPLEVSRLKADFVAPCFVWPAIVHRLESYMIALEGFEKLGISGVPPALALEAFTKDTDADDRMQQRHTEAQHGMGKNYERLEFIGDSLLKMMTTITVFNRTNCDEAGMHCRRMEVLCNRRLFEVSTNKHHLYKYARTSGFNRTTWYPENLVLLRGRGAKKIPEIVKLPEISHDLGMKTIADISEAIIGAAVLSSQKLPNKFDLGIQTISKLVDSEDHAIYAWAEIAATYEAPAWSLRMDDVQANKLAQDILALTDYEFNHPRLLRSAFTHSSDSNSPVPDLQRLEFLGDAVLDWVSISWLFNNNPDRNPQWLTEHKMAMVSNKFLAALAVTLDFDKFLYCSTTQLFADISIYATRVREAYARKDIKRDFWTQIDSPPKALSDLVESYIGAILVDSNFNYDEVEKFFHKHVVWFFEDMSMFDSFANRQPTTFLHRQLTDKFGCRDFDVLAADTDHGLVEPQVTAGVVIHGRVIVNATAASAKYARVKASEKALRELDGLSIQDFRRTFRCCCKTGKVDSN